MRNMTVVFMFFLVSVPLLWAESDFSGLFDKYKVSSIYQGKISEPDLESHHAGKRFRSRLLKGVKQGVNFAGKFCLIQWGCGTNCTQVALVNARTGEIVSQLTTCGYVMYRKDSALLIVNPDKFEGETIAYPPGCRMEMLLMKNSGLKPLAKREK